METGRGNKTGVGTQESLTQAFAFVPHKVTRSKSLNPAPSGASRQRGCWPAHRAPSTLPCGPQPPPGLWVPARAGTQAGLPDTRSRRPAPLPPQFRGSSASTPPGSRQRPLPHSGRPFPRLQRQVPSGAGDAVLFLPPAASLRAPTWRSPHPRPVSSASGRLSSPPGPAPLPGGYSLKPLRISLARSSLADMMRRQPPAALPRWPGGASQTVPRSRGLSCSPAWRPRASSGSGQTRTGLSLHSAPAPDPFSFPLA